MKKFINRIIVIKKKVRNIQTLFLKGIHFLRNHIFMYSAANVSGVLSQSLLHNGQ